MCARNGDKGPLWDSEKGNSACDIERSAVTDADQQMLEKKGHVGRRVLAWGGGEEGHEGGVSMIDDEMRREGRCGAEMKEKRKVKKMLEN